MVILNIRRTTSIAFHDVLHIFWEGCGTGNASLKEKIIQKLTSMREEVLYVIFLYLHKVYDALESDKCLDILEGYGLETQARRILRTYWGILVVVDCVGGY